jgi:hypothetical protein
MPGCLSQVRTSEEREREREREREKERITVEGFMCREVALLSIA